AAPVGAQVKTYTRESLGIPNTPARLQPQPPGVEQVQARERPGDDILGGPAIAKDLPDPETQFRRESEAAFRERIRQESGSQRVVFPEDEPITKAEFAPRPMPPVTRFVEPSYVMHGRLYFEQPNFERQGWSLGVLTPAAHAVVFYKDVLLFPYHYWTRPFD